MILTTAVSVQICLLWTPGLSGSHTNSNVKDETSLPRRCLKAYGTPWCWCDGLSWCHSFASTPPRAATFALVSTIPVVSSTVFIHGFVSTAFAFRVFFPTPARALVGTAFARTLFGVIFACALVTSALHRNTFIASTPHHGCIRTRTLATLAVATAVRISTFTATQAWAFTNRFLIAVGPFV
ncbi:hypothetical protein BC628DRAFT_385947 [Trametes gibbosa]|nr:hypothetical protein BC628DRAFT_385947 [Trametes gibbosa]